MTVRWRGDEIARQVRKAALQGLDDAAEFLLETANRTAPLDEGTMARSGVVSSDSGKMQAAVSYDTPYAVRQHEDTRLRHASGRRAKWLQLAMKEQSKKIRDYIANKIKQAMR